MLDGLLFWELIASTIRSVKFGSIGLTRVFVPLEIVIGLSVVVLRVMQGVTR